MWLFHSCCSRLKMMELRSVPSGRMLLFRRMPSCVHPMLLMALMLCWLRVSARSSILLLSNVSRANWKRRYLVLGLMPVP